MTLNEIVRACFILFTPLLLILHTCGFRPSHGWICKQILNQGASFPSSVPVFQRQCSSATWILWVFRLFPLNTTPTTGPSAALDLQHGLCKYPTRSRPRCTDERPDASESISVSHERPKWSLERAYGGSRCGCSEVSFERVDEFALYSVAQSKEDEISPNFHSQLEESESVLTIPWLRLSFLQSGCALTFLLWRQVIPKH